MRVLLTNDDGIHAPGILALHRALAADPALAPSFTPAHDLYTIAPLTVQSATSHGVTFHEPLMVREASVNALPGVAVDGRPADCVKLALSDLWPRRYGPGTRPDVVISGMNAGANVGINVIYSGTVAAAIEAAFLGVPAIAVSLHLGPERASFDAAARLARRAIDVVLASGLLRPHTIVNINVPRTPAEPEAALSAAPFPEPPIRVCAMNTHGLVDRFERREAPGGQVYYWSAAGGLDFHATDAGTDVEGLMSRCVTITPLRYDLTDHTALDAWSRALAGPVTSPTGRTSR